MLEMIGGPDRDRTGDLFHAMEARSQLRHRPTLRKDCSYSQTCGPLSQTLVESAGKVLGHDAGDQGMSGARRMGAGLDCGPGQLFHAYLLSWIYFRANGN
jgi:hypothetical protein